MKKQILGLFAVFVLLLQSHVLASDSLVAVGKAVGIGVRSQGLVVVGFLENSEAQDCGLRQGDRILRIDGKTVENAEQLRWMLQRKTQVTVTAERMGREKSFLVPLQEESGIMRMGVSVKSEISGIGTMTYYDPDTGEYGALGHGITDGATLFPVTEGVICKAKILRVEEGRPGAPGMLQGEFDFKNPIGTVEKNTACGIFGTLSRKPEGRLVPVGVEETVQRGEAVILCNVEGETVEEYTVEIMEIHDSSRDTGRNMMLRVVDRRLLEKTGGIVQGISGSPILQNGKLIGAVTHVLVNDPSRGYGIFIENMLEAAG